MVKHQKVTSLNNEYKKGFVEGYEAASKKYTKLTMCKNCKWWKLSQYNTMDIHICQKFSGVRGENDFCSRGEEE